jgi:Amt family ammonium transporter
MRSFSVSSKYDVGTMANGILVGLVSVTGSCDNIDNWAACVIGIIGGVAYCFFCKLLEKLEIDDPIEASCVHFAGGSWGVVATGFFDRDLGLFYGHDGCGTFFGY